MKVIMQWLILTKKDYILYEKLTSEEKKIIRVFNFVAEYDGIIEHEEDVKFLLEEGVKKFIPKGRRHLVSITETAYPIRLKY